MMKKKLKNLWNIHLSMNLKKLIQEPRENTKNKL